MLVGEYNIAALGVAQMRPAPIRIIGGLRNRRKARRSLGPARPSYRSLTVEFTVTQTSGLGLLTGIVPVSVRYTVAAGFGARSAVHHRSPLARRPDVGPVAAPEFEVGPVV